MVKSADLPVFASATLRIVCISDTHGEDPSARIPGGDIFIHAGDLTDPGSLPDLQKAYEWISKLPHRVKVVVAGVTFGALGNHDLGLDPAHSGFRKEAVEMFRSPEAVATGIHYLDRQCKTVAYIETTEPSARTAIEPINIYGNPLQPEFLDTNYAFTYEPWPSDASKQAWGDVPTSADVAPIWVMHGPPKGRLDWIDLEGLEGCVAQAHAISISRPLLCVFGHYHVSNGVERVEWCPDRDEVANAKLLPRPISAPEFDFSGDCSESELIPGRDTVFVNAAWMTGRKREVAERNDPCVITLNYPHPSHSGKGVGKAPQT